MKLARGMLSHKARVLIAERKGVRSRGVGEQGRTVNRMNKRQRIGEILEEFKGLQKIAFIKDGEKKQRLRSVRDAAGEAKYDRQEIVDVFAQFYEALYAKRTTATPRERDCSRTSSRIPRITWEEVRAQLATMKNGKAADSAGIVAEMVKVGGTRLYEVLASLFNEIMLEQGMPPDEWKHTRIKVLFKKGDPRLPSNYRRIAILPIFTKYLAESYISA
jgi:hypothetical protein